MKFRKKKAADPAEAAVWNPTFSGKPSKKHEETSWLDKLKDGLELIRNIVFASGLIVVAKVVLQHPESLGMRSLGIFVAYFLGILADFYLLASVIYFDSKHWPTRPKNRREWSAFFLRTLTLFLAVECTLIFVTQNMNWSIKSGRDQIAVASSDGHNDAKERVVSYSFPVAHPRSTDGPFQEADFSYLRKDKPSEAR
jgi:hypothetical protein